jgi:hypothetical protein
LSVFDLLYLCAFTSNAIVVQQYLLLVYSVRAL